MHGIRKPALRLAWCSHAAARFAVERWHYTARLPTGKLVKVGVWEDDAFTGCIVFSRGATGKIGKPFGLDQTEVCELTRVALRDHVWPVSRMLRIAVRMLMSESAGLRLVVSFADTLQGHIGAIYQAGNWIYLGERTNGMHVYRVRGQLFHGRTLHGRYGRGGQSVSWLRRYVDPKADRIVDRVKHKYVWPLDGEMRDRLRSLAKPYPKRAGSKDGVASADQAEKGGSIPTPALHKLHTTAPHATADE